MTNNKKHQDAPVKKTEKNGLMNLFSKNELLRNFRLIDKSVILITSILVIIGLMSVFSASMYTNPTSFITTQTISVFLGYIVIGLILCMPYQLFEEIWILLTATAVLTVLLLFIALRGVNISGATSWIELGGFSFQPSEFVKIISILVVSWLMKYYEREVILSQLRLPKQIHFIAIISIIIPLFFILLQPDYGMLIIIASTLGLMVLLIKGNLKLNIIAYSTLVVGYIILLLIGRQFGDWFVSQDYHVFERLGAFTNPFKYSSDSGYQIIQGLMAFGRGGLFGVGIGKGVSKQGSLPVIESDYILANIGEELGLIGVFVILILMFSLIVILYQRAAASTDMYRKSVLLGIASLILIQSLVNIGGVVSVLPLTGVTLPFISYGGTSMIAMLSAIGIALRMIIEDRKEPSINLVYSRQRGKSDDV